MSDSLTAALVSAVGGGTIVPFAYSVVSRWRSKGVDDQKAKAEIEDLAVHAANEAVRATKGALDVLRQQVLDGHEAMARLEGQHVIDEDTIKQLRKELREARK